MRSGSTFYDFVTGVSILAGWGAEIERVDPTTAAVVVGMSRVTFKLEKMRDGAGDRVQISAASVDPYVAVACGGPGAPVVPVVRVSARTKWADVVEQLGKEFVKQLAAVEAFYAPRWAAHLAGNKARDDAAALLATLFGRKVELPGPITGTDIVIDIWTGGSTGMDHGHGHAVVRHGGTVSLRLDGLTAQNAVRLATFFQLLIGPLGDALASTDKLRESLASGPPPAQNAG